MRRLLVLATVVAAAVAFPAVAAANFTAGEQFVYQGSYDTNAPQGTHLANGSATPTCTIGQDGNSVSCNSYTLGGVGHTNAAVNLTATYSETILCTNHGRQLVVAQTKHQQLPGGPLQASSDKNGNMTVPATGAITPPTSVSGNPCPNRNWTPSLQGTPTLTSFDYTLTFEHHSLPAIEISASDP